MDPSPRMAANQPHRMSHTKASCLHLHGREWELRMSISCAVSVIKYQQRFPFSVNENSLAEESDICVYTL